MMDDLPNAYSDGLNLQAPSSSPLKAEPTKRLMFTETDMD